MKRILCGALVVVFSAIILGCSGGAAVQAPAVQPPAVPGYEFYDRGASSQSEIEDMIGSVAAGYIIADGNGPKSLLVNYIFRNKCAYFPLSASVNGDFIKAIEANPKVCFAVDKYNQMNWWSANVFGNAEIIRDRAQVDAWLADYEKSLGKAGFNYPAESDLANAVIIRVVPETVSGRKMNDPSNPNYAPRLPWMSIRHNKGNADTQARPLPTPADSNTLAQTVSFTNAKPEVVESILKGVGGCRLNMLDSEYPYSIPMSVMSYKDGRVMLHSNKQGQKMDCLRKNNKASLDYQWFWNKSAWISLCLEGHINIAEKPEDIAKVLGMDPGPMFEKMAQRMSVLEFVPERVFIRQIEIPEPWYTRMPGTKTE
ncbi:MAG: pyridoxamine 5'-phosphate oxidase family protein [Candidatus Brocadiia bacterium]